jgi:putative ABC transport system permease protein
MRRFDKASGTHQGHLPSFQLRMGGAGVMMPPVVSKGMWRIIGRQVWSRRDRSIALGAGILVASVSFSLLTADVSTSELEVRSTVAHNFAQQYDILVRPRGTRTSLETSEGVVRPGAISGISGGITLAQWQQILHISGVSVAAPIAVLGYALPQSAFPIDLTSDMGNAQRALFRVNVERVTDDGLTRQADAPVYVYITRNAMVPIPTEGNHLTDVAPKEILGPNDEQPVCVEVLNSSSPFDPTDRGDGIVSFGNVDCWSLKSGLQGESSFAPFASGHAGALVPIYLPFVIAAIDPVQEAKLDGLHAAVVSGRYLEPNDVPSHPLAAFPTYASVPVLASSQPYADESIAATVQQLPASAAQRFVDGSPLIGSDLATFLAAQPAKSLEQVDIEPQQEQNALLGALAGPAEESPNIPAYWSVAPTTYQVGSDGTLVPNEVTNGASTWTAGTFGTYIQAPLSAEDVQFRNLTEHVSPTNLETSQLPALLHSVGVFDPAKLPGFTSTLSNALDIFRAPGLEPADTRSATLLHGQALLPNGNLGGYPTQPPLMLTDLASLPALQGGHYLSNSGAAPISAIRVRVSGVVGVDALSRERVRLVAQRIESETGLDVDITAGSSPSPRTIALSAGHFGRPGLELTEPWAKKGVALAIIQGIDQKSLVLFVLVLVVCVFFLANGAYATVRSRRTELGVLACLGWGRAAVFRLVLGELALVGLAAGVIGAGLAEVLAFVLRLQLPWWHALLVVPIALVLACVAALLPAWAATRGRPLDAIYSVAGGGGSHRPVRGISGIAFANTFRRPARVVSGAIGLFIGVAAFAALLAIQLVFQGQVAGSVLGDLVSVQVRGVDLVAAVLALLLGAFSVADVLAVNLRDRAGEQAVLAATGWRPATLFRLAFTEGMVVGIVGVIAGGIVGVGVAALLTGSALSVAPAVILAALISLALVAAVVIVPALQAARTAPASALAED